MKRFAVTLFVDAEDSVEAVAAACDLAIAEESLQRSAALDDGVVKVRLARAGEGPRA